MEEQSPEHPLLLSILPLPDLSSCPRRPHRAHRPAPAIAALIDAPYVVVRGRPKSPLTLSLPVIAAGTPLARYFPRPLTTPSLRPYPPYCLHPISPTSRARIDSRF